MADKEKNQDRSPQELIDDLRGAQTNLAAGYEEMVQAHDEAQKEKALFEEIFSGSKEAIFLVEKDTGAIAGANTTACEMVGYSLAELTTMHQPDLYPENSREKMKQEFRQVADSGGTSDLQAEMKRKDGKLVPISITSHYLTTGDRPLMVAFIRDLREHGRARRRQHRVRFDPRSQDLFLRRCGRA